MSGASASQWSKEENKAFENALVYFREDGGDEEWKKLASVVPTKTIEEIKLQYYRLVEDIELIEQIPLNNKYFENYQQAWKDVELILSGKRPFPKYDEDDDHNDNTDNDEKQIKEPVDVDGGEREEKKSRVD